MWTNENNAGATPPSSAYTKPAALTVSTSDAMLKSVRYVSPRARTLNVHWAHALTAATIIVSFGPSSNSDAKSTAYDTDIVEPLVASGRLTLSPDAIEEKTRKVTNSAGLSMVCGAKRTNVRTPA